MTTSLLLKKRPGCMCCATLVQLVQRLIEMPVMNRTVNAFAGGGLQQVGELMAAGVGQQVQHADFTAKISALADLPGRQPALRRCRLMLGGNHARAVGNKVLIAPRIKPMISRLAGAHPQHQPRRFVLRLHPILRRRPENIAGGVAHEGAEALAGV